MSVAKKNENQEKTGETAQYKIRTQRIAVYSHFNYRDSAAGGSRPNLYLLVPLFAGEWFILCLLGLLVLGVSLFWKKKRQAY